MTDRPPVSRHLTLEWLLLTIASANRRLGNEARFSPRNSAFAWQSTGAHLVIVS